MPKSWLSWDAGLRSSRGVECGGTRDRRPATSRAWPRPARAHGPLLRCACDRRGPAFRLRMGRVPPAKKSPRLCDPGFPGESEIAAYAWRHSRSVVTRMDASDERTAPVSRLYFEGVAKL